MAWTGMLARLTGLVFGVPELRHVRQHQSGWRYPDEFYLGHKQEGMTAVWVQMTEPQLRNYALAWWKRLVWGSSAASHMTMEVESIACGGEPTRYVLRDDT